MQRNLLLVIFVVIITLIMVNILHRDDNYNLKLEELKHKYALKAVPSVNHSKLPALQKAFKNSAGGHRSLPFLSYRNTQRSDGIIALELGKGIVC